MQETRGSLFFVILCSLFSSSLLLKRENTRPLAPEMNFFIASVHLMWTTFIRGVRSLQSHWSWCLITTLCLRAQKCFTSVYIQKKIGDKRGRRGVENSPGSETHTLGGWDSHTGGVSWCKNGWNTVSFFMLLYEIIQGTKQSLLWAETVVLSWYKLLLKLKLTQHTLHGVTSWYESHSYI